MSLNSNTGAITLTSHVSDVMEDITLDLTAVARDHGKPSLNTTGESGGSSRDTVYMRLRTRSTKNHKRQKFAAFVLFCFYFSLDTKVSYRDFQSMCKPSAISSCFVADLIEGGRFQV